MSPPDPDLVLARDGKVVPEGADRLGRVLGALPTRTEVQRGFVDVLAGDRRAVARQRQVVAHLGTLLLLDAEGVPHE